MVQSLPNAAHREKPTRLCLVVKTLGFFLAQVVSFPNLAEPYPKSAAQPTKFQKGLRPCPAPHYQAWPWSPLSPDAPAHLAPADCSALQSDLLPGTYWHTGLQTALWAHPSPFYYQILWGRASSYAPEHQAIFTAPGTRASGNVC